MSTITGLAPRRQDILGPVVGLPGARRWMFRTAVRCVMRVTATR